MKNTSLGILQNRWKKWRTARAQVIKPMSNTETKQNEKGKESIMTETKTKLNKESRNQKRKEHGRLIFKRGIRHIIYTIYVISTLYCIGEYDVLLHPECLNYQLIALLINVICFGMIVHHTNLLRGE